MVHKNELHLVLTGFIDLKAHPGAVQESVTVASSKDGVNFDLDSGNPMVPGPPKGAPAFFRDPKVFHDPTDDSWKMVVGATNGIEEQAQLYRSPGPFSWSHVGAMYSGKGGTDPLWECPNFFPLGDKWVLFYDANRLTSMRRALTMALYSRARSAVSLMLARRVTQCNGTKMNLDATWPSVRWGTGQHQSGRAVSTAGQDNSL